MSARAGIVASYVTAMKEQFNGTTAPYVSDLFGNVSKDAVFFNQITDFPFISVAPGPEEREYLPSGMIWGFLTVYIRIYVKDETEAQAQLESLITDVENFIDNNLELPYNITTYGDVSLTRHIEDARIESIATDEGLLNPNAVGEIAVRVRYEKSNLFS